jgi:CTP synthase
MVIEAARTLAGLPGPTRPSSTRDTADPVISTMADQRDVVSGERDMGGTMRLGAYPAVLPAGSLVRRRPTAPSRCRSGTGTATR